MDSNERGRLALALHEQGFTLRAIGERLGVSGSRAGDILRRAERRSLAAALGTVGPAWLDMKQANIMVFIGLQTEAEMRGAYASGRLQLTSGGLIVDGKKVDNTGASISKALAAGLGVPLKEDEVAPIADSSIATAVRVLTSIEAGQVTDELIEAAKALLSRYR
jgi:hypothetical protein